jgi:NAD(P)H-dependent FMN reductase
VNLFMFAASLRQGSLNKKLIRNAAELLPPGHEIHLREFNDFQMPLYDGDIEVSSGLPEGALKLFDAVDKAGAVVISTPEYNFGIPGTLKNAIDWTSRKKPTSWQGKQVFLMGASPGMVGTNRGLWQVRQALEANGAFVYPEMMGVALADKVFDSQGKLADPKLRERLEALLKKFLRYAEHATKLQD